MLTLPKYTPAEIYFTESEIDELYYLSVEYNANFLSQQQLLTKIRNLRSGDFVDVTEGLAILADIIILANNANEFQTNPPMNVQPNLQWLYGNNYKPGQFGYGKSARPRSITVRGMIQNAGSDNKDSSSGSWDYVDVIKKLPKQTSKTRIELQVGDHI